MTVEIEIIPDGAAELPVEARDHSVLWNHLQSASLSSGSPITDTHEIERVVTRDRIALRMSGTLADHSSTTLSNVASAITSNVAGTKEHPDGWQEVQEVTQ